ncbi:unnamed protein product [Vitrella brassicaformis CCMP3155]|uniref:Importin subunit alpha n=1 Tax=Vitrella brassicaformis (strain CCMP3155) TaxID=1169540 RepID=A0A0G4GP53_VITBC|nr:unnamed protein product [Vitrella brassicaformis CCMP3155]|eukprot:CEM32057.1 unnamed protein product [Vitrella brassicaformis CCMP3155]
MIWPDLEQLTIPQLIKRLSSPFSLSKVNALRELHRRLILAKGKKESRAAIDATLIAAVLVRLLKSCWRSTAIEAAKCLAAMAAAEADVVIEAGVVPALQQQLSSPHLDVRVQAACAICTIAIKTHKGRLGVSKTSLLGVISSGICKGDPSIQLIAAMALRLLMCIQWGPAMPGIIDAGVIQPLVAVLTDPARPHLQYEAAWALANIAGHGPFPRDLVLAAGVMEPLLKVLHDSKDMWMLRTATWALSNLSQNPQPPFELVSPAVPVVAELIKTPDQDTEVLRGWCRMLSYFTQEGGDERIGAVVDSGVCGRLVELMRHDSHKVQRHALRTVGGITRGTHEQTQVVIECGAIAALKASLSSPNEDIRKEACFAIFNIMGGTRDQRQAVIDSGMVPQLVFIATTDVPSVKQVALWAVMHGVGRGSQAQVEYLVGCGCVGPLCDLLVDGAQVVILNGALVAINKLLDVGHQVQVRDGLPQNPYRNLIQQADGQRRISQLAHHADGGIRIRSRGLLFLLAADGGDTDTDVGSADSDARGSDWETMSEDSVE